MNTELAYNIPCRSGPEQWLEWGGFDYDSVDSQYNLIAAYKQKEIFIS